MCAGMYVNLQQTFTYNPSTKNLKNKKFYLLSRTKIDIFACKVMKCNCCVIYNYPG